MLRRCFAVGFILAAAGLGFADDALSLKVLVREVSEGAICPDGRSVLVVRDSTLYRYDLSSRKESKILSVDFIVTPRMNPAGTKIVFFGEAGAKANKMNGLWIANADGSGLKPFLAQQTPGAEERTPIWSPDGSRVAWSRDGTIWIAKADGSGARALTHGDADSYASPCDWIDDTILIVRKDSVSGEYYAFLVDQDTGETEPTGLPTMSAVFDESIEWLLYYDSGLCLWDVAEQRQDSDALPLNPRFQAEPELTRSADSAKIVFSCMDDDDTSINHLYLLDVSE